MTFRELEFRAKIRAFALEKEELPWARSYFLGVKPRRTNQHSCFSRVNHSQSLHDERIDEANDAH